MSDEVRINGVSSLEMTMRDVLDNMEDAACQLAYDSVPDCFEILSIEPPAPSGPPPAHEEPVPAFLPEYELEVA